MNRGAHIVFICCRCGSGKLTLPALRHVTMADAMERARELRWTFKPNSAEEAVVCPACSKRQAA